MSEHDQDVTDEQTEDAQELDAIDDGGDADPEGSDQLGDPGKRALASMKEKLKNERARRRELEARLAESVKPVDDGEDTPDAETIRREAERKALQAANARILRSEVKAAAAGKLADPGDALRLLDIDQFEVGDDGEIDEDEIADAIDDLLKKKPYLAAQSARRFQGTGDGGSRKGNGRPKQLTRDELKGMDPEAIVKAKAEGRLDDLLGAQR